MFKRNKSHMIDVAPKNIPSDTTSSSSAMDPRADNTVDPASANALTLGEAQHVSIISNDLTILGSDLKIISEGAIRVDGEIQGEIQGVDVTVGRRGRVIGTVTAKRVIIDGTVIGEIQAGQVALQPMSRVEGDIHHLSLSIEQGAMFEGSSKRRKEAPVLAAKPTADLPPLPGSQPRHQSGPKSSPQSDNLDGDWTQDLIHA